MIHELTAMAEAAVQRYASFTTGLRLQADLVARRGPVDEGMRSAAFHDAVDAARAFASLEHSHLNDDTQTIAVAAHARAQSDLKSTPSSIPDRFGDFIFSAALYAARQVAAQAERDVMAMAQHIRNNAQRVDLYVRSGRHTISSAAAAIMIEDASQSTFRFLDRAGRTFKSSKHIRDIYRLHLLNTLNEVYIDTVAASGYDTVIVDHPDANYRWSGQPLMIVSGRGDAPLYYDLRDEIFHPSSQATLTIQGMS